MNFINKLKTFFKATKAESVAIAVRDAFSSARYRYEQSQDAIRPYTTRAKHRAVIFHARYLYEQSQDAKDADAYDKTVAAYTDPADFAPYTEAELDSHTAAMENLTASFDTITAAFAALNSATLNPADEFYVSAGACFNIYCETYKIDVDAYKNAALSAQVTAAEGKQQAAIDEARAWLIEAEAADTDEINQVAAKAESAAFKAKAAEAVTKAKVLKQKAEVAETKAEVLLAKAMSAEAIAEELWEGFNRQC
jgi:hypothetical protein